jgi:hypothetical protein
MVRLHERRLPNNFLRNKVVIIRQEERMKRKIQTMKALTLAASTAGRVMRTMEVLATTSLRQRWMTKTRRSLAKKQVAVLLY